MKTIVFCRHAKSDWPEGVSDINRPLKQRGIDDVVFLGQLLGKKSFQPDLIISSPANRARSTARLAAETIAYQGEIRIEPTVYYEGVGSMLDLVKQLAPGLNSVMIFGHNPTMEQMVRYLLKAESRYEMPTSGMACFESYMDWSLFGDNCALRWLLVPRFQRKG